MKDKPTAKDLVHQSLQEADQFSDRPERPSRPMRPGREPEAEGRFSRQERDAWKNIMIADLLTMLGRDPYYVGIADKIMKGEDLDDGQIQHFLDEGPKFYEFLGPQEKALLDKLLG